MSPFLISTSQRREHATQRAKRWRSNKWPIGRLAALKSRWVRYRTTPTETKTRTVAIRALSMERSGRLQAALQVTNGAITDAGDAEIAQQRSRRSGREEAVIG